MAERRWGGGPAWLALVALLAGSAALWTLSMQAYWGNEALPGARFPLGWWGWFDQGKTLESAVAFANGDLSAARHWYPMGYALLGAPFTAGSPMHAFLYVDLACLLVTLAAFVAFAARIGVWAPVAVAVFVGSVWWDNQILGQWAVPWNSTPAAALAWLVLALCAGWLASGRKGQGRRPLLLGVLAASMPFFRPTEAPAMAACIGWLLVAEWRTGRLRLRHLVRLAAGAALGAAPFLALHVAAHGPGPSDYMVHSRALGFTLHDFGWKAYVVLADPYQWFEDGIGLLRQAPWMAVGLAAVVPAMLRGGAPGALAAALTVHLVLYVSYLDLLPTGLWRFNNVHYWKWALPGWALLAWWLARELAMGLLGLLDRARRRPGPRVSVPVAALVSVALAGSLALVRVAPWPGTVDQPAKMLEFHGDAPGFDQAYFTPFVLRDARGPLSNVTDVRAFPVPGGMRVVALTRRFQGPVAFDPGHGLPPGLAESEPTRFVPRLVPGRPCWVRGSGCGWRVLNPLMPRVPDW